MATSVEETEAFDLAPLGKWSEPSEFHVDRMQLQAYANATNDDIPAHRAGDVASPVFNVVPAFQVVAPLTLNMPPEAKRSMGLHGQQEFRFHRPIEPGMRLVTRALPTGVIPHSTGSTITVKGVTTTSDGEPVVDQWVTVFIRTAIAPEAVGEGPPPYVVERELPPIAEVDRVFDIDQSFRYMGASGDVMPLHTSNEFARAAGLPGIILHGNCTFAFATRMLMGATCDDDVRRIKRLAVRFSRWVTPQDTLTTRVYRAGRRDGRTVYGFESAVGTGELCLSNGLIEVEDQ
ncbi:MaoC/PaaZ C-terminal domain-containing protein [Streptomyces sp. NPDC051320]|uniref:MaoC/PaaZ C-terminal domain-containing protein n=1 Tax=Streptomyces sp. NPDC051320 TaxID=3154644 RepID=UPI00341DAFAA